MRKQTQEEEERNVVALGADHPIYCTFGFRTEWRADRVANVTTAPNCGIGLVGVNAFASTDF
jgi:hypothetical protein